MAQYFQHADSDSGNARHSVGLLWIALAVLILVSWRAADSQAQGHLHALPLSPVEERDLYFRACGLFNRQILPPDSPYIPDRAVCGTPVIMALASNRHRLSKTIQETFAFLFGRPGLARTVISPSGHFKIHYNLVGSHAVDPADADRNGIPDYVDEVARTFDHIWNLEIDQLGYSPPPSDGDDFYDVYIKNLAPESVYGFAYPENLSSPVTSSYMVVDNNYTDAIYQTRGMDGLHVTVAHEFFHAIQFGYYADLHTVGWWQELTATWMEDVAYDEVNDYYQYLRFFFDSPTASLDRYQPWSSDLHVYGASVYAHHLAAVYGDEAIRRSWEVLGERRPSHYTLDDSDAGMPAGGFAGVLPWFAVWNYFTGSRTRTGYYPEADAYPLVGSRAVLLRSGVPVSGSGDIDHLGADYVRVPTADLSGGLRGAFALDGRGAWRFLVLLIAESGVEVLWPADSEVEIPDVQHYQEVVFIPIVTSLEGDRFAYSYTISLDGGTRRASDLVGDFNGDGRVNFQDFLSFAGGFGTKPTRESHNPRFDINADGRIDFQDFLRFARHFGESVY